MSVFEFLLRLLSNYESNKDLKNFIESKLVSVEPSFIQILSCIIILVDNVSEISSNQDVIETDDTQYAVCFLKYELFQLLNGNSINFYLPIDLTYYLSQILCEIISHDTCVLMDELKQELACMKSYYCSLKLTDDQKRYLLDSFITMKQIIEYRYPLELDMMKYFFDKLILIISELSSSHEDQLSRSMCSNDSVDLIDHLLSIIYSLEIFISLIQIKF